MCPVTLPIEKALLDIGQPVYDKMIMTLKKNTTVFCRIVMNILNTLMRYSKNYTVMHIMLLQNQLIGNWENFLSINRLQDS